MPTPHRRQTVLSIVGPGRSGTTLVARILGEVSGIVDAGELYWTWRRGTLEQRPCGCGRSQRECPVWSRVVPRAVGVSDFVTAEIEQAARELVRCQAEVSRLRALPRLLRDTFGDSTGWPALRRLRAVTVALCRELADVTGAQIVVDASKRVADAAVLGGEPAIDHFVLQMVRDPRAVVHSWRRAKPLPTAAGMSTMATRRSPASVARWIEMCETAELLRRHVAPERWHLLRYEDFVAEPQVAVQEILDFLGHPAASPVRRDGTVILGASHTVAGNPDRFRTGEVGITVDDEWRTRMSRSEQVLVGLATAPLSKRYGYPVVPPPAGRREGL